MQQQKQFTRSTFGSVYGADGLPSYIHGETGQHIEMRRRGQRVRYFDMVTDEQVGDEHRNVYPAAVWAHMNGYFAPELLAAGISNAMVVAQLTGQA